MPYVDESVLENNMAKESGIQRLWEDESLHIDMQNLSVCEPGVITKQKEASFLACFKDSVKSAMKVPGSTKNIREQDFVKQIILLLQGIPSQNVFDLEKDTFTFKINQNLLISDLCCTKASIEQLIEEFLQAGCFFLHLREFNEFMSSHKASGAGQVVEAFALAIQDFLIFYQHQVNELSQRAAKRWTEEDRLLFGGSEAGEKKYLTLLEIKVLMEPLLAQIRAVACICFTNKFIDDILAEKQGN